MTADRTIRVPSRYDSSLVLYEGPISGLRRASLRGASLRGANLHGARLNWNSHWLLAEILLQAAGDDPQRRAWAGLVQVSPDWCWPHWAELAQKYPELGSWARGVLLGYVQDGDDAPAELTGGAS